MCPAAHDGAGQRPKCQRNDRDDYRLDPVEHGVSGGQPAEARVRPGERQTEHGRWPDKANPGEQKARPARVQMADVNAHLGRRWPGDQVGCTEHVEKLLSGQPPSLADELLLHHCDMSRRASERRRAQPQKHQRERPQAGITPEGLAFVFPSQPHHGAAPRKSVIALRVSGPWVDDTNVALLADLYQFTMLEAYLEDLRFTESSLEYLGSLGRFSNRLLRYLRGFRFTGSVAALPEGTPLFAEEPILEVVAPLPQAQLVETCLMNQIHVQTMAASKSVRLVAAAQGRTVVDFGLRRAHGVDAGIKVARAAYVAGVQSTSNVLAGCMYGIPLAGTMGHSYIQAHPDQLSAFQAFARSYPHSMLLVDTYDTLEGVRDVIRLARQLGP